jgi:hypothetical protein
VGGDVPPGVAGGDAGLAAEQRDDRVVDVGRGDLPGAGGKQQVNALAGAAVGELRLGRAQGLPDADGLPEDRVNRLGERGPGLVGRDVEQADRVSGQDLRCESPGMAPSCFQRMQPTRSLPISSLRWPENSQAIVMARTSSSG